MVENIPHLIHQVKDPTNLPSIFNLGLFSHFQLLEMGLAVKRPEDWYKTEDLFEEEAQRLGLSFSRKNSAFARLKSQISRSEELTLEIVGDEDNILVADASLWSSARGCVRINDIETARGLGRFYWESSVTLGQYRLLGYPAHYDSHELLIPSPISTDRLTLAN